MIGRPESVVLSRLEMGIQVKAVKYMCGCTREKDEPMAIILFPSRCLQHSQRITGFWRK